MIDLIHRHIIPAAYTLLPAPMESDQATAMLLAIALQESAAAYRKQWNGPARGFWQFEAGGGVAGVLTHSSTSALARRALEQLRYPKTMPTPVVHQVLEHNDILAAVFARLLLWTLAKPLPAAHDSYGAWSQYLAAWRPGKPWPDAWSIHYERAWQIVNQQVSEPSQGVQNI